MKRTINIEDNPELLNAWVRQSISLFAETPYLDNIQNVYPFEIAVSGRMDERQRRQLISAHTSRNAENLLELLQAQVKFPYEEPMWYLLKNIQGCSQRNPRQIRRIAQCLFMMTAEETLARLEASPKLNTQIGPMFRLWSRNQFNSLSVREFENLKEGTYILECSEEEGKLFVQAVLNQEVQKRPDLIAKSDTQYVIGEAKWIGQPGGNQEKQVQEVLKFCQNQRGDVRRIGIVDGFPWALHNRNGNLIGNKEAVLIQESPYDILSALLLDEYLHQFTGLD